MTEGALVACGSLPPVAGTGAPPSCLGGSVLGGVGFNRALCGALPPWPFAVCLPSFWLLALSLDPWPCAPRGRVIRPIESTRSPSSFTQWACLFLQNGGPSGCLTKPPSTLKERSSSSSSPSCLGGSVLGGVGFNRALSGDSRRCLVLVGYDRAAMTEETLVALAELGACLARHGASLSAACGWPGILRWLSGLFFLFLLAELSGLRHTSPLCASAAQRRHPSSVSLLLSDSLASLSAACGWPHPA